MKNELLDSVKFYVITTGNEERVARINRYFEGLDFEFVFSDPYEDFVELEKKYRNYSHKFRQKSIMAGEIGCFKTHTQAWLKVINSGKPGIIVEDNVEFIIKPSRLLEEDAIEYIFKCGLVNFTDFRYILDPFSPYKISDVKEKRPFPTVCYGVTPFRAKNLIGGFSKTAYSLPIDKWLSIPKLSRCYGFMSPIIIAKRSSDLSSIANTKKGRKTHNPMNMVIRLINKIRYDY
ncbi:hypothetical protein VA249_25450 [Vibrio alfacsensis]|uniref:glycosyltransferase family 25 protein n=1 Tax=Vibrio alfacsensis TaxID=1074311 RepID=UPI001BEDD1B6|nr:glycosyltransferase family 25 protein [Vibrio alfacsensis]BBM65899.1 hypothetical protein VA249_25450 [Vibrio alfacsensis]